MPMQLTGAPASWGVDDPKNPYLPPWRTVLSEAAEAGYRAIELGPYGYLPLDAEILAPELASRGLSIVAGTIFHDLIDPDNQASVLRATDEICALITDPRMPKLPSLPGQKRNAPYLTIMDWGHDERDYAAGHSDLAPRLDEETFSRFVAHIKAICDLAASYGVRAVLHPHSGTYLEFEDEIERIADALPYETAGFVLDTGHMFYAGSDPCAMLRKYRDRLDYVHFKDVDPAVYREVMGRRIRFFDGCAIGTMCPVGSGALNYEEIRSVLAEIGYSGYITVEQERDPRNQGSALSDIRQSISYLTELGFRI